MSDTVSLPIYEGAADWRGPDIQNASDWHVNLDESQVAEIKAAVQSTIDNNVAIIDIKPENFPLPNLNVVMKDVYKDLVGGLGFVMFHGMPVQELNREEVIRAYVGVGSYLGAPVPQNRKGHILGHVKDIGFDHKNPDHRIYGTSYRQPYHTDSADIVGLICLKPSKSGGVFTVSSSVAVYNEMVRRRPDLAEVLCTPFIVDRKGEVPEGKADTYEMAIFHHHKGRLLTFHDRNFIDAAQHRDYVPALTERQIEALNFFDELAGSEEFYLDHVWEPGDMGFLHNHQLLHARTDYEDFPELENRRHNLRLWLSANSGWELPEVFAERYGPVELGQRRGGIFVPGMELTVPFEAE